MCVFLLCIVVSKGPVSSTPSSSSSTTPGAAGAGASPSPVSQASPSLALPLAQGERGPSPLHPRSSHLSFFPCFIPNLHFLPLCQNFLILVAIQYLWVLVLIKGKTKINFFWCFFFFFFLQNNTISLEKNMLFFSNANAWIYWNESFSHVCFFAATVKTEPGAGTAVTAGPSPPGTAPLPTSVHIASAATTVKQEQGADNAAHELIK